jgi:type II secretory pathway component GspD/PulD (secretin)
LLNNQVGVIQVGTTTAYLDQSQIETLQGGNTIATVSTNQVQEGVTMRLSANLVGENNIYLSLSPVVTTVDQIRQIVSGTTKIEAPKTTTKSLNTVVKAKDGQTIVIGGLITSRIENADSGIPGINKIPVLKYLFGFRSGSAAKTELIIFITPKKA